MNATELIEFNRSHVLAGEFLRFATDDYLACRVCLLNGLFPGLRLGAEAIEKYLKGFVLYADPSHKKKYLHNIKDVAAAASQKSPGFNTAQFSHVIDHLERHYRQRYPDVPDFDYGASTGELAGIDEFVLHIYESLPIPEAAKFRNVGYYFFVCCSWNPMPTPLVRYKEWLESDNVALNRVRNSLIERYQAVERELKRR
jgi:hypothetical protein